MQKSADCIFVLSTKSAGSSVLQETIFRRTGFQVAPRTRHFENETLYWTKAASVLGLDQIALPMSEVPIPARRAEHELRKFLAENGAGLPAGVPSEAALFEGFRKLCQAQGGLMLEKSPHHLYQAEVIRLMERFADASPSVRVRFIGLIRNPLDTLYSSWKRFGVPPGDEERCWRVAYENLRELAARRPDDVRILRYEDVVSGEADVGAVLEELGIDLSEDAPAPVLHARSVAKWRKDPYFGHLLGAETIRIARSFGYDLPELEGRAPRRVWRNAARYHILRLYGLLPEALRKSLSTARRNFARRG
ncbi:sulfotransferase [Limibaculum sp. M0105]|uniref:Sulfotransferase n=1 Tax=Thermohalobaculum xanthum TaxID=2753746 RepID=A0A8J7M5S8_9RHOB|nr:sulfotransferase [Thermohalobaculum xanthum]MBK0398740.1 sulfotransferase [Thermohalobaculum xanthum]